MKRCANSFILIDLEDMVVLIVLALTVHNRTENKLLCAFKEKENFEIFHYSQINMSYLNFFFFLNPALSVHPVDSREF